MHHVLQRPDEPIFLLQRFGLWCGARRFELETAVQGPEQGLWRDLEGTMLTSLYIVGQVRKQRGGVIGRPSRALRREVQWEVQKGNNDRCTVGPSAWGFQLPVFKREKTVDRRAHLGG